MLVRANLIITVGASNRSNYYRSEPAPARNGTHYLIAPSQLHAQLNNSEFKPDALVTALHQAHMYNGSAIIDAFHSAYRA
jgi:hypothetical protein